MQSEEMCAVLRRWPREVAVDHRTLARESVEHCREVFAATSVVLAFEEGEEPWLILAVSREGNFTLFEQDEMDLESLVDKAYLDQTFYVAPSGEVIVCAGSPAVAAQPVHKGVRAHIGSGSVLSVPIGCATSLGRLFVGDPAVDTDQMLQMVEAVGVIISSRFQATSELADSVREAVDLERVRVARDLHDGLLQSFTGVVLQLETVHSMLENGPEEARRMITDTQATIMADQRELRHFVEQLRPRVVRRQTAFDFGARLEDLQARLSKQWGIDVAVDVKDIDPLVSAFLGQETFRLIHEAVMNSAKHGSASAVRVSVRTAGSEMHIEVTDNGSGFSFQGRRILDQIRDSGEGPIGLAERVASLNGSLVIDSTDAGATVRISVPLGWGGA